VYRFTATGTFDRLLTGVKVVNESGGGHPHPVRIRWCTTQHQECGQEQSCHANPSPRVGRNGWGLCAPFEHKVKRHRRVSGYPRAFHGTLARSGLQGLPCDGAGEDAADY